MSWFKQKTQKEDNNIRAIVIKVLGRIIDATAQKDIVTLGYVNTLEIDDTRFIIRLILNIPIASKQHANSLKKECENIIKTHIKDYKPQVIITAESSPEQGSTAAQNPAKWNQTPLTNVNKIIAIASGKGGVGKSSVTVLLAHALRKQGMRVGILDADVYGPSIPRMLGLSECPKPVTKDGLLHPLRAHDITCMSMGFIAGDNAAILRGPMVSKALFQMLRQTAWGSDDTPLDILLIDMPPGTGDVHLSLAQQVPIDGAIIVTTPQKIATADASKAATMFNKVDIPLLGVIENMSHILHTDGTTLHPFGRGGGVELAQLCGSKLLAQLPLTPALGEALDTGARWENTCGLEHIIKDIL